MPAGWGGRRKLGPLRVASPLAPTWPAGFAAAWQLQLLAWILQAPALVFPPGVIACPADVRRKRGGCSMTRTLTSTTQNLTSASPHVSWRLLRLVCACCSNNIIVPSASVPNHVRCPHCSQLLEVPRSVSRTCKHCGVRSSVDLTSGLRSTVCQSCGRPYVVGTIMAPAVRRRQRRSPSRPWATLGASHREAVAILVAGLIGAVVGMVGMGLSPLVGGKIWMCLRHLLFL